MDIENEIKNEKPLEKRVPIPLYILSGFSFIPAIGILFGLISIIVSLFNFTRFKTIFILGLSGILFSIIIYSTLYYYSNVKRGGVFDKLKAGLSTVIMNNISKKLENYKCHYGKYPESLDAISKDTNGINQIQDPIGNVINNKNLKFYYKPENDTFILFSVGFDGKPFTKDDIYPGLIKLK